MKHRILRVIFVLFLFTLSSSLIGQFAPSQSFETLSSFHASRNRNFVADSTNIHSDETPAIVHETMHEDHQWKTWKLVDNHTFGTNRGSIPMIADLQALHPFFRDKVLLLMNRCRAQGIDMAVVESFRTHAKQAEYFSMGRKYTRFKGGRSRHQYGLAVDVVPIVNGKAEWKNKRLWKKIGITGEKLGLRWGGRWKTPYDPAHFEWTGRVSTRRLAKGILPRIPKKADYPCIEEDLALLRKSWTWWEREQSRRVR